MKEGFSWGLNEIFDNSLNELVNWWFLIFPITIQQLSQQVKKKKQNHCQQESLAQV